MLQHEIKTQPNLHFHKNVCLAIYKTWMLKNKITENILPVEIISLICGYISFVIPTQFKAVFAGETGVGKTTIINQLFDNTLENKSTTSAGICHSFFLWVCLLSLQCFVSITLSFANLR